jgi:hypothetical protein
MSQPPSPDGAPQTACPAQPPHPTLHLSRAPLPPAASSKPVSHELHCPQYSAEDAETTRLLKEQTRIK